MPISVQIFGVGNRKRINSEFRTSENYDFICWILFIFWRFYLFIWKRETTREGTQAGGVGEGEAGLPLSREPDAGLHPRVLGSWPEPKEMLNSWATQVPHICWLLSNKNESYHAWTIVQLQKGLVLDIFKFSFHPFILPFFTNVGNTLIYVTYLIFLHWERTWS